jgi:hypothetical protein
MSDSFECFGVCLEDRHPPEDERGILVSLS